ncbi:hypothetical protein NP233_g6423 [Leucocoprinus birnbaumii]|uniref:Reverse transcriptase domain-containing protein n=1 Tax=Leucocoprinus birnbaumii TaxID=56174 RepID=A0AAD5VR28_9AGAR|nr:hypothetical protein NP233_g6423 [Leucocoprinus birnbaumii]
MAVQGLRTKVNYGTKVPIQYQEIKEDHYFDIINLSNYDLILGTPFLYQHKISICLEPPAVVVRSVHSVPMHGERVTKLSSQSMSKICKKTMDTPLPPLHEINHKILLIDPHKSYLWHTLKCPDKLQELWNIKKDAYICSGCWELYLTRNAVPMLLLPKLTKPGKPLKLWTVMDLRQRNKNTHKLSLPLPDNEGILRSFANAKYRLMIDLLDTYEQIRVKPEHVERTTMNTPSGTMVSHVMQQGDCNTSATFQMIMTRIFKPYLGRELSNLLDDLMVDTQTLKEHIKICMKVIDLLEENHFWVNPNKLHFLEKEFNVLGHIVNDDRIMMDPHKVDALAKWKMPMNRDLLRGFLGPAGYLVDNIDCWEFTHQRAFQEIKDRAIACKGVHYGCLTGIAGVANQGENWKDGHVAAFFSTKLKPAQQNYLVHKIELLAGWYTDHKGLIHLLKQQNLSGRQARWMEKMNQFDFKVIYIPGAENILSDALSHMYSNDGPGTVRAPSEYTYYDIVDVDRMPQHLVTMPLLVGSEGEAKLMVLTRSWVQQVIPDESVPVEERMEGGSTSGTKKTSQNTEQNNKDESKLTIRLPTQPPGIEKATKQTSIERREDNEDATGITQPISADVTRQDNNRRTRNLGANTDTHSHTMTTHVDNTPLINILARGSHLGTKKTLMHLRDVFWWKDMAKDVARFCKLCMTCMRSKPTNHKPYGLLNPLQVPTYPWENIGIDFVGPLPESSNRNATFNAITMIIDRLTVKSTSFTWPTKIHWTKLKMSSAYHPESDGSTEQAIQLVDQLLWNSQSMPLDWRHSCGMILRKKNIPDIISHCVKEVRNANRRCVPSPFTEGDLVYISTKNMSFPKGLARKLVPKFVGPYKITQDFRNNSYKVKISPEMTQRGHLDHQVWDFEETNKEWAVKSIRSHSGSGPNILFKVKWSSGNVIWLPYYQVSHLVAFDHYLNLAGVNGISRLKNSRKGMAEGDLQVSLGFLAFESDIEEISQSTEICMNNGYINPLATTSPIQLPLTSNAHLFFQLKVIILYIMSDDSTFRELPKAIIHELNHPRICIRLPRGVTINFECPC